MSGSIRIVDMPDLGVPTSSASFVGEQGGSGRFSASSLNTYFGGNFLPLAGGTVHGAVTFVAPATLNIQGTPGGSNQLYIDFTETSASGPWGSSILINREYAITGGTSGEVAGGFGSVLSPVVLQSVVTGAPQVFIWNMRSVMELNTTGTSPGQHVGISSSVFRNSGATPSFIYHGQHIDFTGLNQDSAGVVALELDIRANGAEPDASGTNPQFGRRSYIELDSTTNQPAAWVANTAYAAGATVQPTTPNGFTYVCDVAGTTGASQPTWPTSDGVVHDGSVTWIYGTTIAMQVSRAINIGGETIGGVPSVSYGAGIVTSAAYYDAILEFSFAKLVDGGVKDAAIRLAHDMPIDFSGDEGQNLHVLQFTNGVGLQYISQGSGFSTPTPLLTVEDAGGGNVVLYGPLNVGGQGIAYSASLGAGFTNRIALGWDGTHLVLMVNGVNEGRVVVGP